MRPITRFIVAVAVVLMAFAAPPRAGAQTEDRRRDVERALDLARASNAEVEAEVQRLDQTVARQRLSLQAARQAEEAARAKVQVATARLTQIEDRARATKAELARRAVSAYVHPRAQGGLAMYSDAASLGEMAQRRALLSVVQGRTVDVIGELRAVREDQALAADALEEARRGAGERAEREAAETARLEDEQRVQRAAHDELSARISELQAESDALAAEQAALEARIRQRSSPAVSAPPTPSEAPAPARRPASGGSGFVWPVGGVITSEFGPRWGSTHSGIDIGAPEGTPIGAARAGVVISAGWFGAYGYLVVIDHGGGLSTAYAHQSRVAATEGERVEQGDVIGYVGSTGRSTGNHLHFEVRAAGAAQDPRAYLP